MPTGRPRHTLTETDEITAALADATAHLDVCVLIAHVDAVDAHHDRATQDILDRLRIEVHELPHDVGGQLPELRTHVGLTVAPGTS